MHTWYYIVPNYPRLSLALFFCDISFQVRFYDEVERKKYTKIVEDLQKSDKLEMSAEMMHERGGTRFSISSYTPETDNNGDFSNTDNDIRFSISDGSRKPLTHNERVLRDGIVEQMRLGKLESKAKAKLSDTEHKVWNKIVEYVKRALRKIKLFFKPEHTGTQRTQREIDDYIRDLIVDSYANMRSGNTAAVQGEGVRMSAKGKKDVPLRKRKNIPQYAGGRVVGMETLPSDLRTNAARLWNDIFLYHRAEISDALKKGETIFSSEHGGTMFVYSVDNDFNVRVIDGAKGVREDKNKLLEKYGLIRGETLGVSESEQGIEDKGRQNNNPTSVLSDRRTSRNDGLYEGENSSEQSTDKSGMGADDVRTSTASNQSEASERGAARVESVDGLRMRVRSAKKSSKSLKSYLVRAGKAFEDYMWYVYEQTVNMNHTLGEFYKQVNKLRKANGEKKLGVNLDLAHLASNMRGRAAGLANDFSRRYCKPLAEEFEALIKQVSLKRGVPEAKAKRMIDAYLLAYGYENRVLTGKYSDKEAIAKHEEHWAKVRAAERAFEQVIAPQRPEITEWTNPITGVTTYWLNLDGVADELAIISLSAETSFCSSLIMLT